MKKINSEKAKFKSIDFDLRILAASLTVMYGYTPFFINYIGLYESNIMFENILFSTVLAIFIIFLRPWVPSGRYVMASFEKGSLNNKRLIIIFVVSLILFFLSPWHELDTDSIYSNFAAIARAGWVYVTFRSMKKSIRFRIVVLFLTLILMFVDESRTYFFVALMCIAVSFENRKTIIFLGILAIVLLAAVRMSISSNGLIFFYYGIIGEVSGALIGVEQVILSDTGELAILEYLLKLFLAPFLTIIQKFLGVIGLAESIMPGPLLADLVQQELNQSIAYMGGWYIIGSFVYFGNFGLIFMILYMAMTYYVSGILLNTKSFPFGSVLFFISIKASPFVYWNMILYVLVIFYLLTKFHMIVIKKNY